MASTLLIQRTILNGNINPRLECAVDIIDAVSGEEEDAFVIFQRPEEDADELVALEVVRVALFEEDIALVEEEHRIPFRDHFEHGGQRLLDFRRVRP